MRDDQPGGAGRAGIPKVRREVKAVLAVVLALIAGSVGAQPDVSTNFLSNWSFEASSPKDPAPPDGWQRYTTSKIGAFITADASQSGKQCLRFSAQGIPRAFQGLTQRMEIVSGEKYTFAASVMNDPADPLKGVVHLQLCIEWLNAEGREVFRNFTSPQQTFSKTRWTQLMVRKVKAPPGAVCAVVGIHLYEGERGGKGSLFVDDVAFGLAR